MKKKYIIIIFLSIGIFLYFFFQKDNISDKSTIETNSKQIDIFSSRESIKVQEKENIVKQIKEISVKQISKEQKNDEIIEIKDNKILVYYEEKQELLKKINYLDKEEPVYQENDNIYLNIDGERQRITDNKGKYYMPSLSPSNNYLTFYEISKGIFIQNLINGSSINLGMGSHIYWHPNRDIFLFDISKDDGENITASDIYLYDVVENKKINLTNTPNIIEEKAIFSEDGEFIFYQDNKTKKIIQIKLKDIK
jgi:hypothetical protein